MTGSGSGTGTMSGDRSLTARMMGAARLNVDTFEDVEADTSATNQALTVVILVGVCGGLGSLIRNAMQGSTGAGVVGLISGVIGALIGWVLWSYTTYFIGTRVFNGTATPGEMLRTIGFAQSPGILNILLFVPGIGPLISFVVSIWLLVTGVVAVRQALDLDTGKAIVTTLIGWIVWFVVFVVVIGFFVGIIAAALGLAGAAAGTSGG
jgi:hypothetical protein